MATDFQIFSNAVKNALKDGPSILRLDDENGEVVLCKRNRGEDIDDPDCDQLFEALSDGVYSRFRKISGNKEGFTWMMVCGADETSIDQYLEHSFKERSDLELAALGVQAVFQSAKHKDPSLGRRPSF